MKNGPFLLRSHDFCTVLAEENALTIFRKQAGVYEFGALHTVVCLSEKVEKRRKALGGVTGKTESNGETYFLYVMKQIGAYTYFCFYNMFYLMCIMFEYAWSKVWERSGNGRKVR